jgi:hypothetical protein
MRSAALTLALLVALAGLVPAVAAVPPDSGGAAGAVRDAPGQQSLSVSPSASPRVALPASPPAGVNPSTDIAVQIRRNADARWRVVVRYSLSSDNQTRAFRRLGESFENNESAIGPDVALFRRAARQSRTVADREMRIENVSRSYDVRDETGTLALSFTWTNFAEQTETGTLELSDAFRSPGNGTWLSSLEANQKLRVRTPPGYTIGRNPGFPYQNDEITVTRSLLRSNRRLSIEYSRIRQTPSTDGVGGTPKQGGIPDLGDIGAIGIAILAAVVVVLVIAWRQQPIPGSESEPVAEAETDGNGRVEQAIPADDAVDDPEPAPATPEHEGATEPVEGEDGDDEGSDEIDLSLLSDEERIEHLLEQNGGRMKQAHIVQETGWSDAKVSQLLSTMAEEDRVDKLRLGRENLISLPDEAD